MLSTRNPTLAGHLLTNFDALFNIANMLTASLCLSASFGFDERAAAWCLVMFLTFVLVVLGDSTMSDADFKIRGYGYLFSIVLFLSVLVMDAGHLFKDTKTIVLAWGTDGVWLTTAEAIANTTLTGEAPWDVTRHTYARSVTVTRLVLCVVYFYTEFRSSNTIGECSILRNSARRTVGGAHFSLNEPSTRGGGVPPNDDHAECEFDELRLGEATEKAIEPLGKDDEVVALMPAKEFVVHHGPKRTVLFWFCQDAEMTKKVNEFLEGVKVFTAYLILLPFPVVVLAMTETVDVVPYELTWLIILALPDALRKLFKLNTEAVGLVLRELDFWVPFVTMCLGLLFASVSFGHDGAAVLFLALLALQYTVNILLGKHKALFHDQTKGRSHFSPRTTRSRCGPGDTCDKQHVGIGAQIHQRAAFDELVRYLADVRPVPASGKPSVSLPPHVQ